MSAKEGLRERIRTTILENMGLKILSFLCALALYALVHGTENAQRTFQVSVLSLMPESTDRMLLTPPPTVVYVTLRGTRTQLDDLHAEDLGSLRLDLTSGQESTIELTPQMIHVPTGLTVEQVIPSTIKVRWDDATTKALPVQVARTGEPARGFTLKGGISADPPEVQARGPRTLLEALQAVRAAPFDVSGLTEGAVRRQLPLDAPPGLVIYTPDSVFATVEIGREIVKKQFPRLRVEVIGAPRATTNPSWVTVEVTGTREDVNEILPEAIVPRVEPKLAGDDLTHPGSAVMDVRVDVPGSTVGATPSRPGVKVSVEPPKVVVKW